MDVIDVSTTQVPRIIIAERKFDVARVLRADLAHKFPRAYIDLVHTVEDLASAFETKSSMNGYDLAILDDGLPWTHDDLRSAGFIMLRLVGMPPNVVFLTSQKREPPAAGQWSELVTHLGFRLLLVSKAEKSSITIADSISALIGAPPLVELPVTSEILVAGAGVERLLERTHIGQGDLVELSPREFEYLIAELWARFGFEVELTASSHDGGRDIIAMRRREANLRVLIECKRYHANNKVGVTLVRSLYGVKTDERATLAILATTSSFTGPAAKFLQAHPWELEGRDYEGVLNWIQLARS